MYYDYFGFRQPPFKITPDTSLFYPGGDRGAILDALLYAILNGEGIIKVVGEVGSGKTMLCRMLEQELPDKVEVVYLVNPSISPENTLHAIAFELKLGVDTSTSRFEVMNKLQQYLLQRHSENRQVVVFVEEAQSMPIATLEEIRLLSNLETQQSKLLQIVLFGQPELDEMISTPEIRQLKERITYSFQLAPFKTNDIREYINTRIRACGYRSGDLFNEAALKLIEQYSKGLLRRINILADKSLLAAFADNSHKVGVKHARMAARDSEFVRKSAWPVGRILMAGGVALLLIIAAAIWIRLDLTSPPTPPLVLEPATDSPTAATVPQTGQVEPSEGSPPAAAVSSNTVQLPASMPVVVETRIAPAIETAALPPESAIGPDSPPEPTAATAGLIPASIDMSDTVDGTTGISSDQNILPELEENVRINSDFEEVDRTASPVDTPLDRSTTSEDGLLGMSPVYQLQDSGDNRLTTSETAELQNQLLKLPPESAENQSAVPASDICERCWSIIYRPLPIIENL
jgi:MSHA biogenesis protein MshM